MRNVIILGSGRSGTSMLAGTLASAGYDLGGTPYPPRESNPKGFFETHAVNGVNEQILAASMPRHPRFEAGQRWLAELAPSTPLVVPDEARARIQELVSRSPWCFKDPRFCHTLEAWRAHAKDALVLCVFRDPAVTARSIVEECKSADYLASLPMFYERALSVWTNHYAHALKRWRDEGGTASGWRFVHYEQLTGDSAPATFERLAVWTGASIDARFPEARLDRTRCSRAVTSAASAIYDELCELAGHQPSKRVQVAIAGTPSSPDSSVSNRASSASSTGAHTSAGPSMSSTTSSSSAAPSTPRVSVILCTYNRREILEKSLRAWERQDAAPGTFELVVVNDGSRDGTRELLDATSLSIPTRVLHRENGGLAAARNTGIAAARGEFLLFVNDDTIATPSLVSEHLRAHASAASSGQGEVAVLGTFEQPLPALDNALMRVLEVGDLVFRYSDMRSGERYDYQRFWTCNVSVKAALVARAGGFDERFKRYGAEDIDLGFRLQELGVEVLYCASARAQHEHVLDFATFKRRQRTCGHAFVDLFAKEPRCLQHADWSWMRARDLAELERFVDERRSRLPALESAAETLSRIDLGALDSGEAKLTNTVGNLLQELARLLRELNAVWWQQGLIDGLHSHGVASFDAFLARTKPSNGPVQSALARCSGPYERLEGVRELAATGDVALATIEAIRAYVALPAEKTRERADVLNDLAVLRFESQDAEGSLACVDAALALAPGHELALANRRDLRTAAAKLPGRWAKSDPASDVAKALPTDLNPWVAEALELARKRWGLSGKDVLEVGGAVPATAALATGARSWIAGYLEAQPHVEGAYACKQLDARALDLPDASVDVVFSSCAFEHIGDFGRALDEMHRVLRPGGVIATYFSPIWSCAIGHHLWEIDSKGERVTFMDRIVPDWGHLLLERNELETYLAIVLGADTARRCTEFIANNACLNRVLEGDFQRLFREHGFDVGLVESIPSNARQRTTPRMRAELLARYPRGGDFDAQGLRGVLRTLSMPAKRPSVDEIPAALPRGASTKTHGTRVHEVTS